MESLAAFLAAATLALYFLGRDRAAFAVFFLALIFATALLCIHSSDALNLNF